MTDTQKETVTASAAELDRTNLDADWMQYELQRDAEYVAWLTVNDSDRIEGYLHACNYKERLEQWKKIRA